MSRWILYCYQLEYVISCSTWASFWTSLTHRIYRTVIFTYTFSRKTTPVPSMGLVYLPGPTWKWLILTHEFVGEQNHTWPVSWMSHAPVKFNKAQGTSEEDKTQTCQKRYSDRQRTRHGDFFFGDCLVGGFNPAEKYYLNWIIPPQIGLKIKNVWNHLLVVCVLLRFTSFPFCCSFCGKENDRMLHVYLHVPLSQCKCWWSWIVLQAKQESDCVCVCAI